MFGTFALARIHASRLYRIPQMVHTVAASRVLKV